MPESNQYGMVQRLGCSVNAAFLVGDATARDRNAGFRLMPESNQYRIGATPRLQPEGCVPGKRREPCVPGADHSTGTCSRAVAV